MKKAKIIIGEIVELPVYEFAPFRTGWNGWLFQAGIIKKLGKNKNGEVIALVKYPLKGYKQKRYHLNGTEAEIIANSVERWVHSSKLFQYSTISDNRIMEHPREHWCGKTYSENIEFLIDEGVYTEPSRKN